MYKASVSNIESFRIWEGGEDLELAWLLARILGPFEQTPVMRAGEMFHKALEEFNGEADHLEAGGFRFHIDCDVELIHPDAREIPVTMNYGGLLVSGRADAIFGCTVYDHKTTQHFDPEALMQGFQWRYYLDMFGLNTFIWNVFEMKELDFQEYSIAAFHQLEQSRYPELHDDCTRLAAKYRRFAQEHLPSKKIPNFANTLELTASDLAL